MSATVLFAVFLTYPTTRFLGWDVPFGSIHLSPLIRLAYLKILNSLR